MIASLVWQSPNLFWAAALALAAVLAVALGFYRPQIRPLSQASAWAWLSPTMRILALMALATALLRPAILTPMRSPQRGIVAIMVDPSRSMSAVDSGRSPQDLVSYASALGQLPASLRPANLQELRQRVTGLSGRAEDVDRATAEQKYARLAGRAVEAANAHLHDASAALSDQVKAIVDEAPPDLREQIGQIDGPDPSKQIEKVNDLIDVQQNDADTQLYQSNSSVRQTCDALAGQSRIELTARALASQPIAQLARDWPVRVYSGSGPGQDFAEFDPQNLKADQLRTHLISDLRQLRQRLGDQPVAAVLLFSDGRETDPAAQDTLDWPEVPILAVNMGSANPPDLSIDRISLPDTAVAGEVVNVHAIVHGRGFDGRQIQVQFTADQQRQTKQAVITDGSANVDFAFSPQRAGPCEVDLEVASESGEATTANNRGRRMIKVVSGSCSVVYISGAASPDGQELLDALHRMPGMKLSDDAITAGISRIDPNELLAADVVVLSDVAVSMLTPQQWNAVNTAVAQHGATVLIRASDPSILADYANQPLAASLLPWPAGNVPMWRRWPGDEPGFKVAPAGRDVMEMIKLSDDSERNQQLWNSLSPVSRILSLPVKMSGHSLLSERDSGLPVLSEFKVGVGRSLFIATDEIWRWNAMTASEAGGQDRFWTQLIHQASPRPFAAADDLLGLDVDHLLIEPGKPLTIQAQVRRGDASSAHLRLVRAGAAVQDLDMRPLAGSNNLLETVINDLEAGQYTLELSAAGHQVSLPVIVADNDEQEMRDVSGDEDKLHKIVGWRGAVIGLADLPTLPQRLTQFQGNDIHLAEIRLWDSPYLYLFVVACLGVEWAVRKHVGLT